MIRRNLRAAAASLTATTSPFEPAATFMKPGERYNPDALLVERQLLVPDPDQPRKHFDEVGLEQLADSIRQVGVLQPLVVRPWEGGKYAIINGERRWRAACLADVPEIPIIVRDSPEDRRVFEMLIENLQRQDLSIEEEAWAYGTLKERAYSENEIARRLGLNAMRVNRILRLYATPELYGPVARGEMTKSQAFEVLSAPEPFQAALAEGVVAARKRGDTVPIPELRGQVQDTRRDWRQGRPAEEVMESITTRYKLDLAPGEPTVGEEGELVSFIARRRQGGDAPRPTPEARRALQRLAANIETFCREYGETVYGEEDRARLAASGEHLTAVLKRWTESAL